MSADGFFVEFDEETGEVEMIDLTGGENLEQNKENTLDNYTPGQGQEMTEEQAKEITNSIRAAGTALYVLIAQAHEGKAYKALGYESFESYVRQEFDISRNRAYQLLDLSKTVEAIESAAPTGTEVKLTEAQARDIKRELPRITERIQDETDGKTAEESKEIINDVVKEERERIKEEKSKKDKEDYNAYDDSDKDDKSKKDNNGGMDNVNSFDPDDFDSIETSVNNVDNALTSGSSEDDEDAGYTGKAQSRPAVIDPEDLNSFISFLEIVEKLPSIHDFLGSLSPDQRKIISQKSLGASDYLNELLDALAIQEMSRN